MNTRVYQHILTNLDTSEVKTLTASPADWADLTVTHFRDAVYNTVLFEDGSSQRFPKIGGRTFDHAGYYFIIDAFESRGVKARVKYERQILNNNTNAYESDFIGELDFSDDSGFNIQNEWVEVKTIDSRKLAKLLARDEIDVNVFDAESLDGVSVPDFSSPYQEMTRKPIDIYLQCQSSGYFFGTETLTTNAVITQYLLFEYRGTKSINEIGDRISIDDPAVSGTIYTNDLTEDSQLINNIFPFDTNFSIVFNILSGGPVTYDYAVNLMYRVFDSGGTQIEQNLSTTIAFGSGNTSQTIGINESGLGLLFLKPVVDVPEGGRVDFYFAISITPFSLFAFSLQVVVNLNETTSYMRLTDYNFYEKTEGEPENQVRGLYAHELVSRATQLLTSETDTNKLIYAPVLGKSDSEFITYASTGDLAREFLTNGYQIRQFTDRAININFKDTIKSLNAIKPIGVWYDKVNDYLYIDEIDQFYKLEQFPTHLGEVKDLIRKPAKDFYYNQLLSGYPKTEYEDFQGVNEINTATEHSIPIESKSKIDIRSPYYGDSIGIELAARKNKSRFASEDTKYDNNNYFVTLNSSNETVQGDLSSLSGFVGIEQYYNLRKTPRQNLIEQQRLISAALYKDSADVYKFGKSDKDTNISYIDPTTGTTVNEFDNVSQLLTPLVWPEFLEFEGIYTKEIRDEIKQDPHRYYALFDTDGTEYYGYIWQIEAQPYKRTANYTLIRLNENRLP